MLGKTPSKSVQSCIRELFPEGTRSDSSSDDADRWKKYPIWPPDVFAATATLAKLSGFYTRVQPESFSSSHAPLRPSFDIAEIEIIATLWRSGALLSDSEIEEHIGVYSGKMKPETYLAAVKNLWFEKTPLAEFESYRFQFDLILQELWEKLAVCSESLSPSQEEQREHQEWWVWALTLLIIADEASAGIGLESEEIAVGVSERNYGAFNWVQTRFYFGTPGRLLEAADSSEGTYNAPFSATSLVSHDCACVLPKTRTASVGCTLRSLTHHLALTPPRGVVRGDWHLVHGDQSNNPVFNLLLIPFPYQVSGRAFGHDPQHDHIDAARSLPFFVKQEWISRIPSSKAFRKFVTNLVEEAEREVGSVNGIVLPELALDSDIFNTLVKHFTSSKFNLEFLISGVAKKKEDASDNFIGNTVATAVFSKGTNLKNKTIWTNYVTYQDKHHRWKVDRSQIHQYSLGDALDPVRNWWEDLPIDSREMSFFTFRTGACFTTLICEDLARIEPCQEIIRAVGANLVIALLMDGPQMAERWPARYATVLAEDPGSSVITLTSRGLIERSSRLVANPSTSIGLWKDDSGRTQEIKMGPSDHAVLLTLNKEEHEEFTLDGRGDGGWSQSWTLGGVHSLRVSKPPRWL